MGESLRQETNTVQQQRTTYMMKMIVLISGLVAAATAVDVKKDVGLKAASPYTNYGCQCDSLTFTDGRQTHGNCFSTDKTGAKWCYLPQSGSTCTDTRSGGFYSSRFPGRKWSYEACATPAAPFNVAGSMNNGGCTGRRCNNGGSGNNNGGSGNNNGGSGFSNGGSGFTNSGSGFSSGGSGLNNGGSGHNGGSGCTGSRCSNGGSGFNNGGSGFNH